MTSLPLQREHVVLDFVPDALSFRKLRTLRSFGHDSLSPETFHYSIQQAIVYFQETFRGATVVTVQTI